MTIQMVTTKDKNGRRPPLGSLEHPLQAEVGAGAPTYPMKDMPFDRLRAKG